MCVCVWMSDLKMSSLFLDDVAIHYLFLVQAFDQHLNMILSGGEEVVTTLELDEETFEEIYRVGMRHRVCVLVERVLLCGGSACSG